MSLCRLAGDRVLNEKLYDMLVRQLDFESALEKLVSLFQILLDFLILILHMLEGLLDAR